MSHTDWLTDWQTDWRRTDDRQTDRRHTDRQTWETWHLTYWYLVYVTFVKNILFFPALSHGEVETGERLTCWWIRVINLLLPSSYVAVEEGEEIHFVYKESKSELALQLCFVIEFLCVCPFVILCVEIRELRRYCNSSPYIGSTDLVLIAACAYYRVRYLG